MTKAPFPLRHEGGGRGLGRFRHPGLLAGQHPGAGARRLPVQRLRAGGAAAAGRGACFAAGAAAAATLI